MTQKQYDTLYMQLIKMDERIGKLESKATEAQSILNSFASKTIVVSDIDEQLEQLKVDVAALKDEQEEV